MPIITILGGGAFAPRLCEALARQVDLPSVQLRLCGRRADRVEILAAHGAGRVAAARPGWTLRAVPSLDSAVQGATIVVLLIRVGGLEARAWDEAFPLRFGVAGDEGLGPGGFANAWRTLPELGRVAKAIARGAPAARVLNLMAPLGITTRFLLEQGLDALGLCELPLLTLEGWLAATGHSAGEATWRYGGLNHLGWFWDIRAGGEDLLPRLAAAAPAVAPPVDAPTLARWGAAPLRYFYEVFDPDAGARLGLERPRSRARRLRELGDAMVSRFARAPGEPAPEEAARPTPWLDRALAPVVSSLLGGPPHEGFANVRNGELLPELPPELVVELAARVTAGGACPVVPGALPGPVAEFLRAVGQAESLAYQAAGHRDPDRLADAIRALPLNLPGAAARELALLAQRMEPA